MSCLICGSVVEIKIDKTGVTRCKLNVDQKKTVLFYNILQMPLTKCGDYLEEESEDFVSCESCSYLLQQSHSLSTRMERLSYLLREIQGTVVNLLSKTQKDDNLKSSSLKNNLIQLAKSWSKPGSSEHSTHTFPPKRNDFQVEEHFAAIPSNSTSPPCDKDDRVGVDQPLNCSIVSQEYDSKSEMEENDDPCQEGDLQNISDPFLSPFQNDDAHLADQSHVIDIYYEYGSSSEDLQDELNYDYTDFLQNAGKQGSARSSSPLPPSLDYHPTYPHESEAFVRTPFRHVRPPRPPSPTPSTSSSTSTSSLSSSSSMDDLFHEQIIKTKKPKPDAKAEPHHVCLLCQIVCKSHHLLGQHYYFFHNDPTTWPCPVAGCGSEFDSKHKLCSHQRMVHLPKHVQNKDKGKPGSKPRNDAKLSPSPTRFMPYRTYICLLCKDSKFFTCGIRLSAHYSSFHDNPKVWPCGVCSEEFDHYRKLYMHRREVHRNLPYNSYPKVGTPKTRTRTTAVFKTKENGQSTKLLIHKKLFGRFACKSPGLLRSPRIWKCGEWKCHQEFDDHKKLYLHKRDVHNSVAINRHWDASGKNQRFKVGMAQNVENRGEVSIVDEWKEENDAKQCQVIQDESLLRNEDNNSVQISSTNSIPLQQTGEESPQNMQMSPDQTEISKISESVEVGIENDSGSVLLTSEKECSPYFCLVCDIGCERDRILEHHAIMHGDKWVCLVCKMIFPSAVRLFGHRSNVHNNLPRTGIKANE